ncbi:MAG: hypothetical protein PHF61_10745, partial [Bacteroidales bacterium]|nr:hypothetical protein [Bacteroidales bacterium]
MTPPHFELLDEMIKITLLSQNSFLSEVYLNKLIPECIGLLADIMESKCQCLDLVRSKYRLVSTETNVVSGIAGFKFYYSRLMVS